MSGAGGCIVSLSQSIPKAMSSERSNFSTPVTFELDAGSYQLLQDKLKATGLGSVSAVVREALLKFDFSAFPRRKNEKRQLSVRVSSDLRMQLVGASRQANVSQAALLRAALEKLPSVPVTGAQGSSKPTSTMARKTTEKAAKKAVTKKVATKKAAVKKTTKKAVAKKAVAKKAVAKKAVAKKAVKKAPAKKTVAKKAVKKAPAKKAVKKTAKKASRR